MLLYAALPSQLNYCTGFAAWLNCIVELDESEVIMNYFVLPAERSPHPVEIEIQQIVDDNGTSADELWRNDHQLTFPANVVSKWRARLRVPDKLKRRAVQYVMEIFGSSESAEVAHFIPSTWCQGKRMHAQKADTSVTFEIDGNVESSAVELLAGWATGHEAVALTPRLVLLRDSPPEVAEL
jgi:hypothetical protein